MDVEDNSVLRSDIDLTTGSITRHILRMTPPMAVAFFAMMAFNLVDTWYVSKLGTRPLAAMGFTFPVVMVIHSLAMGLGLGTSSCVSRAIGRGDHSRVQHLATYSLLLAFIVLLMLSLVAWGFMPRLIGMLGASDEAGLLAVRYMRILLVFMPIAGLPMIVNNAIRATGDTLRPSIIMSTAAVVNAILDPIFIFGWGPVPAMGISGAALATGLSRLISFVWALWLMHHRCGLLTLQWTGYRQLLRTWGAVLYVAVPSAATNVLMPLTMGIITRLIAGFGEHAVAATAAGQRIEHFAYLIPIAMGTVLIPVIGQNWGADRLDRVREAWFKTNVYGIVYSFCILGLAVPAARPIASCFSRDPEIIRLTTRYLWIILSGAVLIHSAVHAGFAFNAIGKPLHASALTVIRLLGLVLPLARLGQHFYGNIGIYVGMSAANFVSGLIALFWFDRIMNRALISHKTRLRNKCARASGHCNTREVKMVTR